VPSDEKDHVLAIDLGTSGPKVALVTMDGAILGSAFAETPLLLLANGGAEQNPDDWWNAIVKATRQVLEQNVPAVETIAAISCTSQYSSTVPVDRNGRHLMNAINWMDTRGAPYVRRITGGWPRIQGYSIRKLLTWIRLTGGIPTRSGKDSIAHSLYQARAAGHLSGNVSVSRTEGLHQPQADRAACRDL
jgi:xylulokinase